MNRRKAIFRLALAGVGLGAGYTGYKWYSWNKRPDLAYLNDRKPLLSALAETIIPATDTPGAAEAGVGDFIFAMIRDCTEVKSSNKFIEGLKDLESYSKSHFDKEFIACSVEQRTAVLKHFEEKGRGFKGLLGKAEYRFLGKPFFATLKAYTAMGYCSSELGANKGLSYIYIPGRYDGCIPMQPGQKNWATN
jgi:Gluconate 2-dehydrogenase subunit 3